MARQRLRMGVSCRDLQRCSCLLVNTYQDIRLRCRETACSARASPRTNQFGRTTSHAPNFSSAGPTTDNQGMLHLEIAAPARQSFFPGGPESGADRQMISYVG